MSKPKKKNRTKVKNKDKNSVWYTLFLCVYLSTVTISEMISCRERKGKLFQNISTNAEPCAAENYNNIITILLTLSEIVFMTKFYIKILIQNSVSQNLISENN